MNEHGRSSCPTQADLSSACLLTLNHIVELNRANAKA